MSDEISRRDMFAAAALAGILGGHGEDESADPTDELVCHGIRSRAEVYAEWAKEYADAMLAEIPARRARKPERQKER